MLNPDMYAVEVESGRMPAVPGYVELVLLARWMGINPVEMETMPLHWINRCRIVRDAESEAKQEANRKR